MRKEICFALLTCCVMMHTSAQVNPSIKVSMSFDGDVLDHSGNGNHGTLGGNTTYTLDRFNNAGKAIQMNGGTNDCVLLPDFDKLVNGDAFSISLWARSDAENTSCLFMLDPDNANDRCVACAMYKTVGVIWDYGNIFSGGRTVVSNVAFDRKWHHYVFIFDEPNNKKEIYMDGFLLTSKTVNGKLINKKFPLRIGAGNSDMGSGSLRWRGSIDDMLIFDHALEREEVKSVYELPFLPVGTATASVSKIIPENNLPLFYCLPDRHVLKFSEQLEIEKLMIVDLFGNAIREFSGDETKEEFDCSGLVSGIYILRYKYKQGWRSQKILLNDF